eukprot:SAG31_NODE_3380_length_4340_cov_2.414053_1_plen_130_part_00
MPPEPGGVASGVDKLVSGLPQTSEEQPNLRTWAKVRNAQRAVATVSSAEHTEGNTSSSATPRTRSPTAAAKSAVRAVSVLDAVQSAAGNLRWWRFVHSVAQDWPGKKLLSRFCAHYQRNTGLLSRDATH